MTSADCGTNAEDSCYYEGVAIAIIILNCISLLSLSFVLVIYIINWKQIASFPMRLVILSLCILLGSESLCDPLKSYTINQDGQISTSSGYCVFEAILKVTFDLSSIIWTSLIIFSVFASIVLNYSLQSKEVLYLFIAFGCPLIAAIIPAFFQEYGYDIYFCWFDSSNPQIELWFKLGYYFIPLWVLFVVNVVLSQITYKKLKNIGIQQIQLSIFKRIMLFPFILFLTGIFATIDILYTYFSGSFLPWLDFVGIFFISLYGCFTSIAYGFNPIIREKIQILVCPKKNKVIRQRRPTENQEFNTDSNRTTYSSKNTEMLEAQLFSRRFTEQ